MGDLTGDDQATMELLRDAKRIAVVGASPDPSRTSHQIFGYLLAAGYDALPVHPMADEVLGVPAVKDLDAAKAHWNPEPIEIVDVFRRKDATPEVAQQAIAADAEAIWFQLKTDHPDAVAASLDAGLDVVADRCIKIEHGRLIA